MRRMIATLAALWLVGPGLAVSATYDQQATLTSTIPGSPLFGDAYGLILHYHEDYLYVGAVIARPDPNPDKLAQGAVYIYQRSGNSWTPTQILVTEGTSDHFSANSIEARDDWLFISAIGTPIGGTQPVADQDFTGSIQIYRRDHHGQYQFVQAIDKTTPGLSGLSVASPDVAINPPPAPQLHEQGAAFGATFDLNEEGTLLLVGAPTQKNGELINSGQVFAFALEHGHWVLKQTLVDPEGATENGTFGGVVKISGGLAAVSTSALNLDFRSTSNSKVHLYEYDEDLCQWVYLDTAHGDQTNTLSVFSPAFGNNVSLADNYGAVLAFSNKWLLVGAPFENLGSQSIKGAAYLYKVKNGKQGKRLEFVQKIVSEDPDALMTGASVALEGKSALVGDPTRTGPLGQVAQGAIIVYRRDGQTWTKDTDLFDENGAAYQLFGNGVEVQDKHLIGGTGAAPNALFMGFLFYPPFIGLPLPLQPDRVVIWKRQGN